MLNNNFCNAKCIVRWQTGTTNVLLENMGIKVITLDKS